MRLKEALKLEGSEKYQLLNYLVFGADDLPSSIEEIHGGITEGSCEITVLSERCCPVGVVLLEYEFPSFDQLVSGVLSSALKGASVNGFIYSVCMFDGVFMDHTDLLNPDNSAQVYSVFFKGLDINLVMDDRLRNSKEWENTLLNLRKRANKSYDLE